LSSETTDRTQRLYLYKLTTDDGGAPCVHADLLSLAICKPSIRQTAEAGDLIFGFAANSLHPDNRLIYATRVTSTLDGAEYYGDRYVSRPDCIYVYDDRTGSYTFRRGACYHGADENLRHDLGDPPDYDRARVLLSEGDSFRYFGDSNLVDFDDYPVLMDTLRDLGRGHRVNHPEALEHELVALEQRLWREYEGNVLGAPSGQPESRESPHDEDCITIIRTC